MTALTSQNLANLSGLHTFEASTYLFPHFFDKKT